MKPILVWSSIVLTARLHSSTLWSSPLGVFQANKMKTSRAFLCGSPRWLLFFNWVLSRKVLNLGIMSYCKEIWMLILQLNPDVWNGNRVFRSQTCFGPFIQDNPHLVLIQQMHHTNSAILYVKKHQTLLKVTCSQCFWTTVTVPFGGVRVQPYSANVSYVLDLSPIQYSLISYWILSMYQMKEVSHCN